LIFKISQNLPFLFEGFENGLNIVLIQYPADTVVPFIYGKMEKVLCPSYLVMVVRWGSLP